MAHYARNQHQQPHRPQPLSLHPSSSHSHQNYPTPLHSAPLPSHTQYANMPSAQHRQQHGGGNAPLSAAYAQFQSSQLAYLQEMERNLVLQQQLQQQIMLQQQQVELEQQAERAMREMSIAATAASLGVAHHAPPPPSQQRGYGGQGRPHYQQQGPQAPANQNQAPNPLVASALARRAKRQSFNGTDGQYAPHQQPGYPPAAQAPRFAQSQHHQRRATPPHLSPSHSPARSGFTRGSSPSPVSAHPSSHSPSPTTRGPRRPSPPPPAVILSAPGEPYPDTSSSGSSSSRAGSEDEASDSGETRPSSPEREKEVKKERRRSHLDSLAMLGAAASARNANANGNGNQGGNRNERRRPVSINGPPGGVPSPRLPSSFARDAPPHAHVHPAHGKRTVSTPASTGALSASASSFAPLPNNSNASAAPPLAHSTSSPAAAFGFSRQSAPPVPGTATATRQPKGPPTELGKSEEGVNFGQRIRQRAVRDLRGLALARGAGRAGVVSPPQVVAY